MQPFVEAQEEFQILFEGAPDLLYTQDLAGRVARVNRTFERVTGFSRTEIVGTSVYDLVAPEHREILSQKIIERMGGAPAYPFDVDFLGKRRRICIELSIELIFHAGIPAGLQGFGRDLTEKIRERIERAAADKTLLRQTEQLATFSRYLQLLHRLSTTTYPVLDDLFSDYLSTGCEIFGLDCAAITESRSDSLKTRQTCGNAVGIDRRAERVLYAMATIVDDLSASLEGSFYVGTPLVVNGDVYGVLAFWGPNGEKTHTQATEIIEMMARGIESAVHQRRMTEELEYRARHDSLTGLANRFLMLQQLDFALSESRGGGLGVAIVFIDLDDFKSINDNLGHSSGDLVLRAVAASLSKFAGPNCSLARIGGDEFIAIIREVVTKEAAVAIARGLIDSVTEPLDIYGTELRLTASAGLSLYPEDGLDQDTLLRLADAAMYSAKQMGGNLVQCASVVPAKE